MPEHEPLLAEDEAADYVGRVPPATLRQWRYLGTGPQYVKVGRHVRYRRTDLDKWLADRTVTPEQAS
jgi:predicted DNA-binding transcriptional regulator AlpA